MRVRPLESNTRVRNDHNTAGAIIRLVHPTDILTGEEVFVAPNDLANANGIFQRAGDRWLKIGPSEWVALTNMGIPICEEVTDIPTEIYLKHTIETYSDGSIRIDGTYTYP